MRHKTHIFCLSLIAVFGACTKPADKDSATAEKTITLPTYIDTSAPPVNGPLPPPFPPDSYPVLPFPHQVKPANPPAVGKPRPVAPAGVPERDSATKPRFSIDESGAVKPIPRP